MPGFDQDSFTRTFNWVHSLVGEDMGMEVYFPVFGPAFPTPERRWDEDGGVEVSFPIFPAFPMPDNLQEPEDPSLFAGNDPPATLSDSEDEEPVITRYVITASSVIFQRLLREEGEATKKDG